MLLFFFYTSFSLKDLKNIISWQTQELGHGLMFIMILVRLTWDMISVIFLFIATHHLLNIFHLIIITIDFP